MELSDEKKKALTRRLLLSRMRILQMHGFYGLLLMQIKFALSDDCETAGTDGTYIFFSPSFLEELSDTELDFVMMHEILHVALRHCFRTGDRDREAFNIACDIVVNSNILKDNNMNPDSISLRKYGVSMHLTPGNREGYLYTAEEVYEMLPKRRGRSPSSRDGHSCCSWDDHSCWGKTDPSDAGYLKDLWMQRTREAAESVKIQDPSNSRGLIPAGMQRALEEEKTVKTDWRMVLNEFIQKEVTDYTFMPPDRRFNESDFFLPDYGESEDKAENILFWIDTSGSISDHQMSVAYAEIECAIEQFNGKIQGWLGFFDAAVVEPRPFSDLGELRMIKPKGGGGTNFDILFAYVRENMQANLPEAIIILTDGYAPFPGEDAAQGIPVLWVMNNDEVTPPWGKIIRITEDV